VNFYAQQKRALNLAWALHADEQIMPGQSIAVIGGGITGLTLAAGLISLGCRVDIFEAGGTPLHRQLSTQHRMAHPTINNWPRMAPEITTNLPFLDWHVGPCNVVAKSIVDQFEDLRSRFEVGRKQESRVLKGVTADKILDVAEGLVMIKSNAETDETYRLAIIAIGFGKELDPTPFESPEYWHADKLISDRDSHKYEYYIVSGAGDGGLIDALRIAHPKFDHGKLAFEVAADLYDTPIATAIIAAESKAAGQSNPDLGALQKAYEEAVALLVTEDRYSEVNAKLKASLADFKKLIFLLDVKLKPPFSLSAAPIHKLMIEHARRMGKVTYKSGSIEDDGDKYLIDGQSVAKDKSMVVIRHGADPKPGLNVLISKDEIAVLEGRQKHLSDHIIRQAWEAPFPVVKGIPEHMPSTDVFIDHRQEMAETAVQMLDPKAKLQRVVGGYEVMFRDAVPTMARGDLFGVATAYLSTPISNGFPG
jgi:hypothetical protein